MSEITYSAPCARTSSTCQSYATNSAVRPLGSRGAFGICRDGRGKSSYEAIWSQFPSIVLFNEDPATHKRCDGCSFCDGCWMWFSERHKTLERLKRLPKALWMTLARFNAAHMLRISHNGFPWFLPSQEGQPGEQGFGRHLLNYAGL